MKRYVAQSWISLERSDRFFNFGALPRLTRELFSRPGVPESILATVVGLSFGAMAYLGLILSVSK